MDKEPRRLSVFKQSKVDEIKARAPEFYKALLIFKKKFGSFIIKNLKFKEK